VLKCFVRVRLSHVVFYLVIDGNKFDFWLIINKIIKCYFKTLYYAMRQVDDLTELAGFRLF